MHNNGLPYISVIVPVYNGQKVIRKCVQSLIDQDYPKDRYEIIVVDNNSKDRTAEIIKTFPVQYLFENHKQSPATARNAGAAKAKGEILAFFDSDQMAEKGYLSHLIQGWENEEYGAFGSICQYIPNHDDISWNQQCVKEEEFLKGFTAKDGRTYAKLGGGNSAYRSRVFAELKGFDEDMFSSEDLDLVLRMQKQGYKVKYNFEAISYHRTRDWKSLLKRECRIGYGNGLLWKKEPLTRRNFFVLGIHLLYRTFLGLCVITVSLIKSIFNPKYKTKTCTVLLDVAVRWANYLGHLWAYIFSSRCGVPADW